MQVGDLERLPPSFAVGTGRVFARRHLLRYRHPAVMHPEDFLASLEGAFGPPPPEDPAGYVFLHRPTATHFTAYVHKTFSAYGGGLRFQGSPDARSISEAYAAESKRVAKLSEAAPPADPLVADLVGGAASYADHMREVEAARRLAPPGFHSLLMELEALLERFPPPDRREVQVFGLVGGLTGPVSIVASGVSNGRYFERAVGFEDARRALEAKLPGRADAVADAMLAWWSGHSRLPKPEESAWPLLLAAWRRRFEDLLAARASAIEEQYRSEARERHEKHEQGERWMRVAKLGLYLPLAAEDVERLLSRANWLAMQSTEYKKLEQLRKKMRAG